MPGNCAFMSKPFEAVEQPNNDYWTCLSSAKEQEKPFWHLEILFEKFTHFLYCNNFSYLGFQVTHGGKRLPSNDCNGFLFCSFENNKTLDETSLSRVFP